MHMDTIYWHVNATQGGENLHPGVNLHQGANLHHPGANCAYEHGLRWPPFLYMVKYVLQNQKFYDLETWHAASGTEVLQSLNFMARSNLDVYSVCM